MFQIESSMKKSPVYNIILSAILYVCTASLYSCSTEDIPVWNSETAAYAQFTSPADCIYSFAGSPHETTEAVVEIPITLHLDPAADGHEIWIDVTKMPSNQQTRFEYSSRITVKPGDTSAQLTVKLYRSPNLVQEADEIEFIIVDSPSVKAGFPENRCCKLIVTDFFVKPDWWGDSYDSYYNPLGICNNLKLELWFEVFGNFDDPRHGRRAWTNDDAVIALALINQASMERYGKMFYELQPTDLPLN